MLEKEWDELSRQKAYFEEIISPFSDKNSIKVLHDEIKRFSSKRKSAIDLGTGLGNLVPFLCSNFKTVDAIDYSPKMVEYVGRRNKKLANLECEKKDMRNMSFRKKFDFAVAVNSIISPSVKDVDLILKKIHSLLAENGKFVGVFPSLESVLYMAMLIYDDKRKRHSRKIARNKTKKIIESHAYDFLLGFLVEKGGEQKHFYEFELEYRLKKAGFKNTKIKKIYYDWKILADKDRYFPKEEKIWDWLVTASK